MIENYFRRGAVIGNHNFAEAPGTAMSESTSGVNDQTVVVSWNDKEPTCCGLMSKEVRLQQNVRFRFLPYSQGAINYCDAQGRDVVSAYFSGCIMARYKRDGVWRVCHVSTGEPNDCKSRWAEIKAEPGVSDVTEFKPSDHAPAVRILGLITSTGERYAIGCYPLTEGLRIDSVVRVA